MDPMIHGWILKIVARDLILGLIACIGWQNLVYNSPLTERMRPLKFNKDYQHPKHLKREIFYSISTILCGAFWEVLIMYMYATGYCTTWYIDFNQHVASRWTMIITCAIWRDAYFWWVHRFMHHWNTKYIPDVGAFFYRIAHSVHHKSRNIQPWSGISMHPIEGLLYESAVFLIMPFHHHPILFNLIKIDL